MSADLQAQFALADGVRRLTGVIADDLAAGRSIALLLPVHAPSSTLILDVVADRLVRSGHQFRRATLMPEHDLDRPPVSIIADLLDLPPPPPAATAEELYELIDRAAVEHQGTDPQTLIIDGIALGKPAANSGPPAARYETWGEWLRQWSQISQGRVGVPRLAIAIALPAPAGGTLTSELLLGVYRWWGVLSVMDLRLACRGQRSSDQLGAGEPAALWREFVLPPLVSGDYQLARELWDDCLRDFDILFKRLREIAARKNWCSTDLDTWGARLGPHLVNGFYQPAPSAIEPPRWARGLWEQGLLCWTPEYGLELSLLALAVLDRRADIRHRFWRGQVALLMPIINHIRLMACEDLTAVYRTTEWARYLCPKHYEEHLPEYIADPLLCEISHMLPHYWPDRNRRLPVSPRGRPRDELKSAIKKLNDIRKCIAHYKPISFSEFEQLWSKLSRLDRFAAEQRF